jgi:hypothetical protein
VNVGGFKLPACGFNRISAWDTDEMAERPGSVGRAILWMFVLSVLLFWLPILGPLIAGFVGGRKAGGVGNAIVAVILPGVVFGVVLFLLASMLTGMPILGFLAGAGGAVLALAHIGPLLLGAILGAIV